MKRVETGATESDGVSVLRGESIKALLASKFDDDCSLSSVYNVLKRLKFNRIKPRLRHEKSDPALMAQWVQEILPTKLTVATLQPRTKSR